MSRNLTTAMQAEIVKPTVSPFLLFECTLADDTVARYWTGGTTLSWGGNSYISSGMLIAVGAVEETDDVQAQGVSVSLNGVPLASISLALASLANGKQGILRLGFMTGNPPSVIPDPKILFRGRLDLCEVTDGQAAMLKLSYEHELVDLERPREWRYTNEHQQKLYPGDLGLIHIAALQDAQIPFGNRYATSRFSS